MDKSTSVQQRHSRLIRYVPLFLWVGVILLLSTGQGAMSNTSRFIRPLLEFLFPNAPEATLIFYHGIIRKFAHFTEYAVLGLLASRTFAYSSKPLLRNYWPLAAAALIALVACADEFNQSFNPRRTGSPYDVLIDIAGGLAAIILYWLRTNRPPRNTR